jgi:hypothetical protein
MTLLKVTANAEWKHPCIFTVDEREVSVHSSYCEKIVTFPATFQYFILMREKDYCKAESFYWRNRNA